MNFLNSRSKIYSIGGAIFGLGAIIPNAIVFFGSNKDMAQSVTLLNIGQGSLGLLFMLLGTQTLFANRKKIGYIYYILAAFIFSVLFARII